ncbi:hypothetical protein DFH27DRAFT_354688 [Peziza echinospora]|nr:hypothetical protein DFH27DRAFT_354688 [Peziza echinospora]
MKTNYTDFKSYEDVKKEREIRQREIQKLMEESKKPKEPIVKPLSRATLSEVEKVLSDRNQGRPLIEKFRVTIHTKDVQTLREKTWLNDEIVNFYLSMVCERANIGSEGKIKVFAFNSFFYKKLSEAGYKSVERWSRKGKIDGDNLLRLDYLIIPVHLSYHWTLGVVNFTKKRVEYFDSLGGRGGQFFKHIRSYLSNESRNKINLDEWVDYSMKGAPMQENGYDCGVFLCKTAEVVCRGLDPIFTQNDITLLRKRMVAEIIKGELGVE